MGDTSKPLIHAVLRDPTLSRNYVYIPLVWGITFAQSIVGNLDQAVVNLPDNDMRPLPDLVRQTRSLGRKPLFISNSLRTAQQVEILRTEFSIRRCAAIPETAVWQIYLEYDGNSDNPCFRYP